MSFIHYSLLVCMRLCACASHTHVTSQQICQPGRRGRCCGSEVSLRCAAASGPSGGWRLRPASPSPPRAPTPTGCHWAHPPCPPSAWEKAGRGDGERQEQIRKKEQRKGMNGLLKYLIFIRANSKSQRCQSNNITSYVTLKHPWPFAKSWRGIFRSNCVA